MMLYMLKKTNTMIALKVFKESYINEDYLSWLNDKEVTKFLEIRFQKQTFKYRQFRRSNY